MAGQDFSATLQQAIANFGLLDQMVQGDAATTVTTRGGPVPSIQQLIALMANRVLSSLTTTSTTVIDLTTGSKTFVVEAGKIFKAGTNIVLSCPGGFMLGLVTSYAGTSLVVNVTDVVGTGSGSAWNISFTGPKGPAGPKGADATGGSGNTGTGQTKHYISVYPWENVVTPPTTPSIAAALTATPTTLTTAGSVSLTANIAVTNTTVSHVDFYRGSTKIATVNQSPFVFSDPHTYADNGSISYTAVAFDTTTLSATTTAVNVTVNIPIPDTTAPTISLACDTTGVNANATVHLTATANDNVGVTKVDFLRNGSVFTTVTSTNSTFIASQVLTSVDDGTVAYTAKAYDAAGNTTLSQEVDVVVNIAPPATITQLTIDNVTSASTQQAINGASTGTSNNGKRLAGANAIVNAMAPSQSLAIYRNGVVIFPVQFSNSMTVYNDGTDIGVQLGNVSSGAASQAADINTGTWTFQLTGGSSGQSVISGTVGPVGSGANIILQDSPYQGQQFDAVIVFLMDRSIDGQT